MSFKGRAQCLIFRGNKILMVKHRLHDEEWFCLPGGEIKPEETPEEAAIRELKEECLVIGKVLIKTSEYVDPFDDKKFFYTFYVEIGNQTPTLGVDPECMENPVLIDVCWMALTEISEKDRAYLWAAGLISIRQFAEELSTWSKEISYPNKLKY